MDVCMYISYVSVNILTRTCMYALVYRCMDEYLHVYIDVCILKLWIHLLPWLDICFWKALLSKKWFANFSLTRKFDKQPYLEAAITAIALFPASDALHVKRKYYALPYVHIPTDIIYVCRDIVLYVYIYMAYDQVRMYVFVCLSMHLLLSMCLCVSLHLCMKYLSTYVCLYVCMYKYICVYVCMLYVCILCVCTKDVCKCVSNHLMKNGNTPKTAGPPSWPFAGEVLLAQLVDYMGVCM